MITVIGAGPVGSYSAYLLAKAGLDVQIFEEHKSVGKPVQCTGITTKALGNFVNLKKDFVINKTSHAKIHSKNNSIKIPLEEIVLNRTKFDRYVANKAADAGAKIHFNHKYINGEIKGKFKKSTDDILIGSDGPLSNVAKHYNLIGNRKFLHGMQARVKFESGNYFQTFFGDVCPGFFAWIVPESDTIARIGLASAKDTKLYYSRFLKKLNIKKVLEVQSGLIPIFCEKQKIFHKNVFLIGDSAAQVKATTGGGLVPGLHSAKVLANSIINGGNYEKMFHKSIGKELKLHKMIRDTLNKFNNRDYDNILELLKKQKIQNILSNYNRDYPSEFILNILVNEPRFLFFLKKLF